MSQGRAPGCRDRLGWRARVGRPRRAHGGAGVEVRRDGLWPRGGPEAVMRRPRAPS
ncbi:hypothetical protein [Ornithinimicrobium kibberense]|uniref:hypothetical protein n=1 Tax=Ornithinimicrobium kibberense TaxID=282060 RepID=UPI00361CD85A